MGGSGLHPGEEERIERTETHGAGKSFDRLFRLTQEDFSPSTLVPRQRKVRIQHDRAIEQRGTFINLAGYKGQRIPSLSERKRILVAQQRSAPRQARCLSNHFGWQQPAPDHLKSIAMGRHCVADCEARIEFNSFEKQFSGLGSPPYI